MNFHAHANALKESLASLLNEYPEMADDERLRADMFEGETDLNWLLSQLVDAALDASTMAEAVASRIADMTERKRRFEAKETGVRNIITSILEAAGLQKIQLTDATLSLRNIAPSPIITDETVLPDNCVRFIRKPNMAAIKAAMEASGDVPGVALSNGKISLTIRTK